MPHYLEEIYSLGGKVYEVGGAVRDRFLKLPHKDSDLLVTHVSIDLLTRTLKKFGDIQTVGKSFGVIKFYPRQTPQTCIDIALPRKEVSTGAGHRDFQVDFDPYIPVEIDLSRRDFTINAMARECVTSVLHDPFQGQRDLENKILRAVSNKSFEEDPLRLMRGIQFAARFILTLAPETYDSMKRNASRIKTVSPERISEEIRKLLSAEKPSIGFILMNEVGLLREVFPELAENVGVEQGNKFQNDDVFMHTMRVLDASRKDDSIPQAGDLELMLSALFHDVGKARTKRFDKEKNRLTFYNHQFLSRKMAKVRMQNLKMSVIGVDIDRVARLVEEHMFQTKSFFTDRAIRRFVNKVGSDLILKLVDLRIADNRGGKYPEGIKGVLRLRRKIQEEIDKKTPFSVRDLAIGGKEVMALGVPEGPLVGRILKELIEHVLDDPDLNTVEKLSELAVKVLADGFKKSEEAQRNQHEEDNCEG